jgi:hypothetical protein
MCSHCQVETISVVMVWCEVQIERLDRIPSTIELARKTPKTNDKQETCKQLSMEVLACSYEHLGVIKFFAIHRKIMEAYTLWWNGGTIWKMLDYNMKYFPLTDNCTLLHQGSSNMEGQTWLVAFKRNCVKLAWAFINIMNIVHHCGILHNLYKDNIMLHLLVDKLDVVYIGMFNWGETGCL